MSDAFPNLKLAFPEHFEGDEDPTEIPPGLRNAVDQIAQLEGSAGDGFLAWKGDTPYGTLRRLRSLGDQDPARALEELEAQLAARNAILPGQPVWGIVAAAKKVLGAHGALGAYVTILGAKQPTVQLDKLRHNLPTAFIAGVVYAQSELVRLGMFKGSPEEALLETISEAVQIRTQELKKLASEASEVVTSVETAEVAASLKFSEFETTSREGIDAVREKLAEATLAVDQLLRESQAKADELRELILVKEPVSYWENRASNSGRFALLYLALTGVGLFGCGWFVLWTWRATNEAEMVLSIQQGAAVAAAFLLCAWFVRFFSKLFLAKAHAKEDADERVAMIKTYLALTTEDNGVLEQRSLMLQSIFRPGGTGLLGADPLPPGVQGVIQALVTKLGGKTGP